MISMNRAVLIGKIGQDPEARSTESGASIARISLATNRATKVDGQWVETVDWHRLIAEGATATYLVKHAHKGDMLAVDCTIRPQKWADADGRTHHDVQLVIERVVSLIPLCRNTEQIEAPPSDSF